MNPSDAAVEVEQVIYDCMDLEKPRSFFLFAGAGSGKTRSLVNVLEKFRSERSGQLRFSGQRIAIITYTNAACDEIIRRLEFDSTFIVSTIHSFSWELIRAFQSDIRQWVRKNTKEEIEELEEKQLKGRVGTKASADREIQIASKRNRLEYIDTVKAFTYNPNGINSGRDSLSHSEVISITSSFLLERPLMKRILIGKYPIMLIDESQDTKKELIDALFSIQNEYKAKFALGLFGDTMQRIYTDGKNNLAGVIPSDWLKPEKTINYRSPDRIIELINKIRAEVDDHVQRSFASVTTGTVRLFVVDTNIQVDKTLIEKSIAHIMSVAAKDELWNEPKDGIKVLILEHHMAARRGGFLDFFEPLYRVDKFSTGLLDGTLPGIAFLTNQLLPLVEAQLRGDEFAVAQIVLENSPILNKRELAQLVDPVKEIRIANSAVKIIGELCSKGGDPRIVDLLRKIAEFNLLVIPEVLSPIANRTAGQDRSPEENDPEKDETIEAWDSALNCPISQLAAYNDYIMDRSTFGTHQGVKGLEFPRVMVILDDDEARGFMFSYDKLFGATAQSDTDKKNLMEGKETSADRTRRLFYVTCSRAKQSLAIVAYTKKVSIVKQFAIERGWFRKEEVFENPNYSADT